MASDNDAALAELLDMSKKHIAAKKKTADGIRKFGRFLLGLTFVLVLIVVIAQPADDNQAAPNDTKLWLIGAGLVFLCSIIAHFVANAYEA